MKKKNMLLWNLSLVFLTGEVGEERFDCKQGSKFWSLAQERRAESPMLEEESTEK